MERDSLKFKLNIKDYNNELEKILSNKNYTESTKNLLSSMLYKIENAYKDYSMVTVNTRSKKEILEEILITIRDNCDNIEITKTNKSMSFPEEKKIVTYLNDRKMLYEIIQMRSNKFRVQEDCDVVRLALEETLNQGYSIYVNEVIRDFDGWTWNIAEKDIENDISNLLFQIIRILIDQKFLIDWQKDINSNYIKKLYYTLQEKYGEKISNEILKEIKQIAIIGYLNNKPREKKKIIKVQETLQAKFDEIDDKKKYVIDLTNQKKSITKKIKDIDSILCNDKKLKREFIAKNQGLDMEHRIFSLSDFAEILEEQRAQLLEELNTCSRKMEPIYYIEEKKKIKDNLELIKELELQDVNNQKSIEVIKKFLISVIEALKIQISNAKTKDEIRKLIYSIRYFRHIYITDKQKVKDIVDTNDVQKLIITRGCKEKILTMFSKNIEENYEILKVIFDSNIIELEKAFLKINKAEDKTIIEIYDEEVLSETTEVGIVKELNIRANKKIRVFI